MLSWKKVFCEFDRKQEKKGREGKGRETEGLKGKWNPHQPANVEYFDLFIKGSDIIV